MECVGKMKRSGDLWLAEVPELDVTSQGETRDEALIMMVDAIESLVDDGAFKVAAGFICYDNFFVNSNDDKKLGDLCRSRAR